MSAPEVEAIGQHWPTWIEDRNETSRLWETVDYNLFRSLKFENEHTHPPKHDSTVEPSSDTLHICQSISCHECSRPFSGRRTLRRHLNTVHRRQWSFPCLECDKVFSRSDQLKRHRRERHRKIEPVECMRCGKLVKDRSLNDHLRSGRCKRHRNEAEHYVHATPIAADAHAAMLAAIFQKTEEDCLLFESFSTRSVCDPLSVSSYLSYKVAQGWNKRQNCDTVPFATREPEPDLFDLRGLTIRSIVRGLATGLLDDELDGAIRAFALTERMLFPGAAKIHDAVVQYLDADRCHRLQQVLSGLKDALDQWTPVSTIMHNMLASKGSEETIATFRNSTPKIPHLLEPRKSVIDYWSVPRIPPKLSSPSFASAMKITADNDHTNDNRVPLTALTKRKRKSNDATSNRPNKQKICPKCGTSVVQRVLARHLRQVHGEGEVYECDEDDCEKVFLRKDSFDRHKYYKHGEGSNKIECMKCGASVCRRAMEEHVRRPICQKRGSLENQTVAGDSG